MPAFSQTVSNDVFSDGSVLTNHLVCHVNIVAQWCINGKLNVSLHSYCLLVCSYSFHYLLHWYVVWNLNNTHFSDGHCWWHSLKVQGIVNVCAKFDGNSTTTFQDSSLWTKVLLEIAITKMFTVGFTAGIQSHSPHNCINTYTHTCVHLRAHVQGTWDCFLPMMAPYSFSWIFSVQRQAPDVSIRQNWAMCV